MLCSGSAPSAVNCVQFVNINSQMGEKCGGLENFNNIYELYHFRSIILYSQGHRDGVGHDVTVNYENVEASSASVRFDINSAEK